MDLHPRPQTRAVPQDFLCDSLIQMSDQSLLRTAVQPHILVTFFLGFSSGVPYSLIESTLQVWLSDSKVDIRSIGLYSCVLLPYALKFLWAPIFDQIAPPFFGRRRGWAIMTQIGLILSLLGLSQANPVTGPWTVAVLSLIVGIMSASQDIVLDAHRRETLAESELGLGAALFTNGYRLGFIASAALPLHLSLSMAWSDIYILMATLIGVGIIAITFAPEPVVNTTKAKSFQEMFVAPFAEFFSRDTALLLLAVVFFYKIGDSMAAALRTKFLLDIGYDRALIVQIAKVFGLVMSIGGAFLGAFLMVQLGVARSLWLFGALQALSTLGFWWLTLIEPQGWALALVISFENGTGGMGTSAYVAFLMSICDRRFSATQYAGLSSLMRLPSITASAMTGYLVAWFGWGNFFLFCFFVAFPVFFLLPRVAPWKRPT